MTCRNVWNEVAPRVSAAFGRFASTEASDRSMGAIMKRT